MKRILLSLTITLFFSLPFGEGWGGAAFAQKQGQQKIDSLLVVLSTAKEDTSKVNTLIVIATEKINVGDYTEARKYADDALALAERNRFKKGTANSYNLIGWIYEDLSDYPKALEYDQKELTINEQLGNKKGYCG